MSWIEAITRTRLPVHRFLLPIERVIRLGPEVSKYRRSIKAISSIAASDRVTTAMSRPLERTVTSGEAMASAVRLLVAGAALVAEAGACAGAISGGGDLGAAIGMGLPSEVASLAGGGEAGGGLTADGGAIAPI